MSGGIKISVWRWREGGKKKSLQLLEEGKAINPFASWEPQLRLGGMACLEALKGSESWKDTTEAVLGPGPSKDIALIGSLALASVDQ